MSVAIVAEVAVVGIGVGIEMHHADGATGGDGAQYRQADQMIPAGAQRRRAGAMEHAEKLLDAPQRVGQVDGVDRCVAEVGHPAQVVRRDSTCRVYPAHQARLVADLAWPVACAGAVGGAAVPRYSDQRDVDQRRILDRRQAHERRRATETRHRVGSHRLKPSLILHHYPPWEIPCLHASPLCGASATNRGTSKIRG